jgi:hypothetical protein
VHLSDSVAPCSEGLFAKEASHRLRSILKVPALLLLALSCDLSAQVSPAGRWRTLHSEHFRVHFRPGYDSIAHHAAAEAERAYFLLSTELVRPRQNIDVVLSDAADFSNGAAGVFPSNRITLLLVPPTNEPDLQNYDDWLREVIVHELAHIFHLDRVKGPWRLVQSVLGRVPGAFPNAYQPSWVTEGIATYYESHLTGRGRIPGSFHTEVLLSLAGADRWPRANAAIYLSEKWPDGVAPYAFGSRFFNYLRTATGDSSVPRFIEKTSGQWIPFRTGRPLRLATRFNRDSIWKAHAQDYEERAHGRPATEAEVVVRRLRVAPAPAVSEDGSLAWFESGLKEAPAIVIRRHNVREERHISTAGVDLAWNGDTLYATRLEVTAPGIYRSDLYRLVEGDWEQLTRGERLTDIAVGRGGVVAVQLNESGNRLVRWSGDSLVILSMAPSAGNATVASPSVTLDGRIVAVRHQEGSYQLIVGYGDSASVVLRATSNEVLADPVWLPGNLRELLFVSDVTGLPQVYLRSLGLNVQQVTHEPFGARQPVPGGDGWLYFSAVESDGYALKRVRWAGQTAAVADTAPLPRRPAAQPSAVPPFRHTAYSPWSALRPHYFIPYLVNKGSAGYFLGAFTSGTDPVGRFAYALRGAKSSRGGKVDASMSLVYRRWTHHSVDFFMAQDHGDAGVVTVGPATHAVVSRERDLELGFNSIWRRWYRSFTLRVAADYEEDRFISDPRLNFVNPEFGALSAGVSLGRSLRPPLAISYEDGAVVSLRYRRRWRLDRDGGSDEWRGRLAIYQSIKGVGGFAHPVIAGRVSAATSSGEDRETFGIGGASGITYQPLPGIVAGSGRAFPVRGFEPGEIRGGTVAVGTAELRLPLALVAQPLWDLPYGLDRVSLRIFYDYGRVWDPPVSGLTHWIHSTGVEVTWDLLVLYDVPLRLRTGVATALTDGSTTRQGDLRFGIGFGSEF